MQRARRVTRQRIAKIGLLAALVALVSALGVAGCGGGDDTTSSRLELGSGSGGSIDVVGYSTPESVYQEALEPAFEETSEGSGVSFSNSFGASGDQSRAVAAGQPASVVHFAQAGDMERLVEEGQVDAGWDKQPNGGIAQDSVVVITVRKGNPDGIKTLE